MSRSQRHITRRSHLADLIQGSGLVGGFHANRSASAGGHKKKKKAGQVGPGAGPGAARDPVVGGVDEGRWRPQSAPPARTASYSKSTSGGVSVSGKDKPHVLTDRNVLGDGEERVKRPSSALASYRRSTIHEIPSISTSHSALSEPSTYSKSTKREQVGAEDVGSFLDPNQAASRREAWKEKESRVRGAGERPSSSSAFSTLPARPASALSYGETVPDTTNTRPSSSGHAAFDDTNPKRRYEKLRLLSKIMKRLEQEIGVAESRVTDKLDSIISQQDERLSRVEGNNKSGVVILKANLGKLERKCREFDIDLKQNNKKWIEEIKIAKYGHQKELAKLNEVLEDERDHLQRTLLKHKEAKDLWHKTELENSEHLKLVTRNLEKAERKHTFLTKELDETLDHLHAAQHKLVNQDMEMNVMKNELAAAEEKLAAAQDTIQTQSNEGHDSPREKSPERPSHADSMNTEKEPFAFHLFGGEEQRKKLKEKQKHIVSLEKEIRRLNMQLKTIRSEGMARHSVVLSELEERLQHSEEMGLKARISASHVVKRIKELLEKYYKPQNLSCNNNTTTTGVVTKKHMEQIHQELILIFDKLEDLDQIDLSTDGVESVSDESSEKSPSGMERARTISNGAEMSEREATILECTEYSIQASEETENLSRVAQLEMQVLDSKVEAERAAKEAFDSIGKAQALEDELTVTKEKLKEAEKVLARKKSEWMPIGEYVDMSRKAEKAMMTVRGLKDELARQRTALKFAKQEKDQREEDLKEANSSGFELHQNVTKLSDELKSANFQLKHLRSYCDTLKFQREEEMDKLRGENEAQCNELQSQLKKMTRRADLLQDNESKLDREIRNLNNKVTNFESSDLELKDLLHIANQDKERMKVEYLELEQKLRKTEQALQVADANVRYFQTRQQDPSKVRKQGTDQPALALETVFDIFVGDEGE